jgi:hypothetical protein
MFKGFIENINKKNRNRFLIILLVLLLIFIVIMRYFDSFLINKVSQNGIVSFELAKDIETSKDIINSWNKQARRSANLSMAFDFLFLIIYSSFIALLIHKLNERLLKNEAFYSLGKLLIWTPFIAAFFDILENYALIKLLLGDLQQMWSTMAYYFAITKFGLLAIAISYVLVGFFIVFFRKRDNYVKM